MINTMPFANIQFGKSLAWHRNFSFRSPSALIWGWIISNKNFDNFIITFCCIVAACKANFKFQSFP